MRIVVSGASGLIGSALVADLTASGHDVVRLVRSAPSGQADQQWDPAAGGLDPTAMAGTDAIINLSGESIAARRWSPAQKARLLSSRLQATRLLAETAAKLNPAPAVFLSASAIGFYGDRGDEELTEDSGPGEGFLADLTGQWENATAEAETAGIRVVHLRTGIVQSPKGGALAKQLPLFRVGVGGKLGRGRQWLSWISLDDEIGGILHALGRDDLRGPINLTAPHPVTNAEYTKTLAATLHRPSFATVPGFALAVALGKELAGELLGSQRVLPAKLEAAGYRFRDTDLAAALARMLS
jgi:uncharacterized protein (TIGR01777 family)